MPLNQSIIACPSASQSGIHMIVLYVACRIEAAVRHLISLHPAQWPNWWYEMLKLEHDINIHVRALHETRVTVPLPVPAPQATLLACGWDQELLKRELFKLKSVPFQIADRIPRIVPNWDVSKREQFEGAWWWAEPHENPTRPNPRTLMRWGKVYFQDLWPQGQSPIDELHQRELDRREVELLEMLRICLAEEWDIRCEMQFIAGRTQELLHMLNETEADKDLFDFPKA
ncbi:hypothetical protein EV363DRAFT_1454328 [Boletus edulis]|nr:hypothetical protein EV363DRAFT_1454328 [Boletus edulis]